MKRHFGLAIAAFCAPMVLLAGQAMAADAKATNKPAAAKTESKATNKAAKTATKPATKATPATPATPASASKDATGKPTAKATPAAASKPAAKAAKKAAAADSGGSVVSRSGNVVEWKTSTGKILHYDCSKPGNKNKQACQGK